MSIDLYHTQCIRGFQQEELSYSGRTMRLKLKRTRFHCRRCGSEDVSAEAINLRHAHGEPMGYCREVVDEAKLASHTDILQ